MRVYRDDQKALNVRINILIWAIVAGFVFLAGAFWWVQGVQADKFRGLAESNALREVVIPAKRGLILDRNGRILADNQPAYALTLIRPSLKAVTKTDPGHKEKMVRFVAETLGIQEAELVARMEKGKVLPFNQPMPLAEDLTIPQVSRIEANQIAFPALSVTNIQRRNYRYGTFAAHLLGYIGEATEKDLLIHKDWKLGDLTGKKGVELVYNDFLRGKDGAEFWIYDAKGRKLEEVRAARREPVPGRNVTITLDFELQRRAEQYYNDNEMVGATVALDPRNGEVLTMVSSPAYDPNVYSKRFSPEVWKTIYSNPFKLEVNRAISGLYSPGSVFKAVVAMAGLETGVVNTATSVGCVGSGFFSGRRFRCWKREGHGAVDVDRALKVSCDIFFYTTGQRLGVDRIAQFAKGLTFGEISKVDLDGEKAGLVPSTEWARVKQKRKWYPSETISVAIGQGPLIVTPLQTANLMAAIANGGKVFRPHVLKEVEEISPEGKVSRSRVASEVLHEIKMPKAALDAVKAGLWQVVNEQGGTGGNARVEGLNVVGKTGSVQVIAQHGWVKTEHLPFKHKDHAWFASYAPLDDPKLVVVVFVEHGGHGGGDAAPLAKLMYEGRFTNQLATSNLNLADPETLKKIKEGNLPLPGQTR
ncbi:MAG TPA: penicillin-binding protein 2 [Thermoanaerobaculia bacterium]|nr:penicillin-binding protein 2 [Thermoanaerobaculia bacterium]